eukprot:scaffold70505_cov19-Tisochrysis_lutea.AAC.2
MCVPLYDSLGENAVEYIVDHAECTCVFLSSDKFPQLVKVWPSGLFDLPGKTFLRTRCSVPPWYGSRASHCTVYLLKCLK